MDPTDPWHSDHSVMRRTICAGVTSILRRLHNARSRRPLTAAVAVLTTHRHGRRTLRREVERAMRQLSRVLPLTPPIAVSVIVQQVLGSERQLVGSYQISQRPDGTRQVLFRLALVTNGAWLNTDTILAVLAEEWVGYVTQEFEESSVSVPVELPNTRWTISWREAALRAAQWESRHRSVNNASRAA